MEETIYDLTDFDEEDLIRWNRLENDIEEIFDNAEKNLHGGVEWKRCGILMRMI